MLIKNETNLSNMEIGKLIDIVQNIIKNSFQKPMLFV